MKTRSAKNKGKRLQNEVRDLILETFKQLEPDDVRSTTMGDSGEDVLLSPAARKLFPFSVECKNQAVVSEQAFTALNALRQRSWIGGRIPVLTSNAWTGGWVPALSSIV